MQRLRRFLPFTLAALCFVVAGWFLPAAWCRRGAADWFRGSAATQSSLAQTVVLQGKGNLTVDDYKTGVPQFSGEWLFGTHLMAGIGFCQMVSEHPELRAELEPNIERCIQQLLSKEVREFDRASWRADPLENLEKGEGHAAYLGYLNFLLSLYRQLNPSNQFVALNDQLTETLIRRMEQSGNGLIATYPGEWYAVDNTPVLASIAITGRLTNRGYSKFLAMEERIFRTQIIDRSSGLLIQALNQQGEALNSGRGSGSALGIFFLHHAFPELSREIYGAIKRSLATNFLNYGAIREYPHGMIGPSDIDSGPILFGYGFSATGFTIGAARIYGDEEMYGRLYSSAILAGVPSRADGRLNFLAGGSLGNAILLAVLTAPAQP